MHTGDSKNVLTVEIREPVLSQSVLPDLGNVDAVQQVDIKFRKNVLFNSIGIRFWIAWLSPFAKRSDVVICFHECPVLVVHQINTVMSFLPKNGEVISFYAPFYSPETEESQQVLLVKGHHFFDDKINLPEVLDSNHRAMILDSPELRYFSFLKKKSKG